MQKCSKLQEEIAKELKIEKNMSNMKNKIK